MTEFMVNDEVEGKLKVDLGDINAYETGVE